MGVTERFGGRRCVVAGVGELAIAITERLRSEGGQLVRLDGAPASLAYEATVARAIVEALEELGGLDILVTAFATREDRAFLELDDAAWTRTLDENLKSAFLVARECARSMAKGNGGVIVHVGSDVAARPGRGTAAYAAAKAGVHLLATASALDLAPHGIRVCAVAACEDGSESVATAPPGIEALVSAVAFCASDDASYVLGSTFYLNGPLPVRS